MPIEIQELSVEALPNAASPPPATNAPAAAAPDLNESIQRWHRDAVVHRDRLRAD